MNPFNAFILFLALVLFALIIYIAIRAREHFDGAGLVYNIPPNWFMKQDYDPRDWLVRVYIDKIQPTCLPYNIEDKYGPIERLNYLASSTRFWRM
jgi:hypothetical protein